MKRYSNRNSMVHISNLGIEHQIWSLFQLLKEKMICYLQSQTMSYLFTNLQCLKRK